jgi:gamma-glutamyltranspeptidase/glutathione hydrolase
METMRWAPGRPPAVARDGMVATSQVPAVLAGLGALRAGGSAADAAVAAAAVLCVAEPMATGLGGDCFALVFDGDQAVGLDGGGAAPRSASGPPAARGPRSVVVPGVVGSWSALLERFGRLGLDRVLTPAIDAAEGGVAAGAHCAAAWQGSRVAPAALGRPPRVGEVFRLPELGGTLRRVAEEGPRGFYEGPVADALARASWLAPEDLAAFAARWVTPMRGTYGGLEVLEMPPPTQGVAALEGLGLLALMPDRGLVSKVRSVALALEDARRVVRDEARVDHLLAPEALAGRAEASPTLLKELAGGTVYVAVVDGEGMAVSLIQSLYEDFGSGVVAEGTGVVLNNRAACFAVEGEVQPGRRPYHTTIPGMLLADGRLRGPFGVVGGFLQAQAHVQLVSSLVDDGLDPQAALDRPRFRVEDGAVHLEGGQWPDAASLRAAGYPVVLEADRVDFGGGQLIWLEDGRLLGGSDPRKDGCALGW